MLLDLVPDLQEFSVYRPPVQGISRNTLNSDDADLAVLLPPYLPEGKRGHHQRSALQNSPRRREVCGHSR